MRWRIEFDLPPNEGKKALGYEYLIGHAILQLFSAVRDSHCGPITSREWQEGEVTDPKWSNG